jgi:hypothetical protein
MWPSVATALVLPLHTGAAKAPLCNNDKDNELSMSLARDTNSWNYGDPIIGSIRLWRARATNRVDSTYRQDWRHRPVKAARLPGHGCQRLE